MEYLLQFFSGISDNPNHVRWLLAAAVGVAITLFGLGLLFLAAGFFDPFRRRLGSVGGIGMAKGSGSQGFGDVVAPFAPYLLPKKNEEQSKFRVRLTRAGYRSDSAITTFYAIKVLLALICGAAVIIMATWFPRFTVFQVVTGALFFSFIGLMLPNYILSKREISRKRQIMNGFPDAIDLLVVCTEAGLGLNAALQRVANEIVVSYPILSEELTMVNDEILAGVDRIDALRNLSARTGIEDIQGLVSLLSQSLRFGTSIADTLRVYSEEFRDKRMQRAEEQAAMLATKMIFPMVFCMFPAFFIVAIGPAILGVFSAFKNL